MLDPSADLGDLYEHYYALCVLDAVVLLRSIFNSVHIWSQPIIYLDLEQYFLYLKMDSMEQ